MTLVAQGRGADSPEGRGHTRPKAAPGQGQPSGNTHPDIYYEVELDAEWYEQQVEGKPPMLVPPRFITLQIGESKDERSPSNEPRKIVFEHPMWRRFNKYTPLKYKVEGRRTRKGPGSWSSETPLPKLLGGFERPPKRG